MLAPLFAPKAAFLYQKEEAGKKSSFSPPSALIWNQVILDTSLGGTDVANTFTQLLGLT